MQQEVDTAKYRRPHPPGDAPANWAVDRGLEYPLVLACGVHLSGHNLVFYYESTNERRPTATRVLNCKTGMRYWNRGDRAQGALWTPKNPYLQDSKTALITEGESDALSAVQARCPWVVMSAPGANMLHQSLVLSVLPSKGITRVVIAFDNDEAGRKGARSLSAYQGGQVRQALLHPPEEGQDLNEWLRAGRHRVGTADWKAMLDSINAVPLYRPRANGNVDYRPLSYEPRDTEKPSLHQVWRAMCTWPDSHKRPRKDAKGRVVQEVYCPFHDDGRKPGAWLGEERFGCWVCDIEGDVYELAAWRAGIVPVGTKLRGEDFKRAKEIAHGYTVQL